MKSWAMDKTALYQFMSRQPYGVVASTALDGSPQSALVGIAVTPTIEVIFDTLRTSRKYANITARCRCSFVIGWDSDETVQLEGDVHEPMGEDLRAYQEIYFARWPEGRARMAWPDIAYFVMRPRWIRYCDYGVAPPRILEDFL